MERERPLFNSMGTMVGVSSSSPGLRLLVFLLVVIQGLKAQIPTDCSVSTDCGSNSTCSSSGVCGCDSGHFSLTGSNTDCRSLTEPDPRCANYDDSENCVICGVNFEGPCLRCTVFISQNSECLDTCQVDVEINVITQIGGTATARTCNVASLPSWVLPVIIASIVVVIIVIILIIVVAFCLQRSGRGEFNISSDGETPSGTMRTRRSNSFSKYRPGKMNAESSLVHRNDIYTDFDEDEIDGDDEEIFKHKLNRLRKESEVFLQMLNDMRRRAKELPPDSPVAEKYKNVMQDVTRLLYLLNKKPSRVKMPVDGIELVRWSENILKRYVATQDKQKSLDADEIPSYMEGGSQGSRQFMEKLNHLRDHSQVFLRMLNEMRRRLKELRPETPTAQNYRVISKDLTRLLELLNKRPSAVEMPVDGLELVMKSERLLQRYLQSQGIPTDNFESEQLSAFGTHYETEF